MPDNKVVSHEEWLKARLELLAAEKEFTRQRDALTRRRMVMPWERVEKSYQFEGANGALSLADLFDGRSQLIVYHFMFGPDWEEGCKSCSFWADNFNGTPIHLNHRDVTFTAVSHAHSSRLTPTRIAWAGASRGSRHTEAISISIITCRLRPNKSLRVRRTTTMRFDRLMCRTSRESVSSIRMREVRCSTPILVTGGALTWSTVPTSSSTLCPKAAISISSHS